MYCPVPGCLAGRVALGILSACCAPGYSTGCQLRQIMQDGSAKGILRRLEHWDDGQQDVARRQQSTNYMLHSIESVPSGITLSLSYSPTQRACAQQQACLLEPAPESLSS